MTAPDDAPVGDRGEQLQAAADRLIARFIGHDAAQDDPDALNSVIAAQVAEDEDGRAAAKAAIEDTVAWSSGAIDVFVGLAQLRTVLEHGHWSSTVGQRLLKAAAEVRTTLGEIPDLVDRLESVGEHLAGLDIDLDQDEVYRLVEERLGQAPHRKAPVGNRPLGALAVCAGRSTESADRDALLERQERATRRLDALRRQTDPDTPGVAL